MTRSTLAILLAVLVLPIAVPDAGAQHEGHQPSTSTPAPTQQPKPPAPVDHSQHQVPASELPPFIPRLTDEDRKAAFPDLEGHAVHDRAMHSYVLFDQLELQSTAGDTAVALDSKGWIGQERDRLWFRVEGDGDTGRVDESRVHLLYGRQISRWWDAVGGVRQDFRPGPAQTWAAVGLQGLAPYWFEIEATGYVGAGRRTHARFEVEYELLLTNRLVAQPLAEIELFGQSDPERGIGAGLSTTDVGLRLRYEFKRELAPYVGIVWRNKWGKTADFAETTGEDAGGPRFVTGVRLWF